MRDHVASISESRVCDDGVGLHCVVHQPLQGPAGPFDLDVALEIGRGEFVTIVGPSGAGKTTLLRVVAGLAVPHHGVIRCGGETWCDTARGTSVPTRRRSIGFVFQDYALFPNMTVRGNIEYATGAGHKRSEVDRLLELVDLAGLQSASPERLSGGQRQRLALVRALARRPALFMLDEPLSALDWDMRRRLQDELRDLHSAFGTTTLMVSHDPAEILRLADRVIRLEAGRVAFDGEPARAFGSAQPTGSFTCFGNHIDGPDGAGLATVMIDGRTVRVRYRSSTAPLSRGDRVALTFEDADVTAGESQGRAMLSETGRFSGGEFT